MAYFQERQQAHKNDIMSLSDKGLTTTTTTTMGGVTEAEAAEVTADVKQKVPLHHQHQHQQQHPSPPYNHSPEYGKAISFLRHEKVHSLPNSEKEAFLRSNSSLNEEDIQRALKEAVMVQEDPLSLAWNHVHAPHLGNSTSVAPSSSLPSHPVPHQPPFSSTYPSQQPAAPLLEDSASLWFLPMAVGSMAGLAAVAAFRWLNGGDFQLFPPPSIREVPLTKKEEEDQDETQNTIPFEENHDPASSETSGDDEEEDDDDYYETIEEERVPVVVPAGLTELATQVGELTSVIQWHLTRSARDANHKEGSRLTNSAMDLLGGGNTKKVEESSSSNSNTTTTTTMTLIQLAELRTELSCLRPILLANQNANANNSSSSSDITMSKLLEIMEKIQASVQAIELKLTPNLGEQNKDSKHLDDDSNKVTNPSIVGTIDGSQPLPLVKGNDDDNNGEVVVKEGGSEMLLAKALRTLVKENVDNLVALRTGAQMLYLYMVNLSSHLHVPRYRKIYIQDKFTQRVDSLTGGRDVLLAVGFQEFPKYLEYHGPENDTTLLKEAAAALTIVKSATFDGTTDTLACLSSGAKEESSSSSSQTTPPSSPSITRTLSAERRLLNSLKTPEGVILSPPVPLKKTMLPSDLSDKFASLAHEDHEHSNQQLQEQKDRPPSPPNLL